MSLDEPGNYWIGTALVRETSASTNRPYVSKTELIIFLFLLLIQNIEVISKLPRVLKPGIETTGGVLLTRRARGQSAVTGFTDWGPTSYPCLRRSSPRSESLFSNPNTRPSRNSKSVIPNRMQSTLSSGDRKREHRADLRIYASRIPPRVRVRPSCTASLGNRRSIVQSRATRTLRARPGILNR